MLMSSAHSAPLFRLVMSRSLDQRSPTTGLLATHYWAVEELLPGRKNVQENSVAYRYDHMTLLFIAC